MPYRMANFKQRKSYIVIYMYADRRKIIIPAKQLAERRGGLQR